MEHGQLHMAILNKIKQDIKKLIWEGNPCHDPKSGKFCGTGGGSAGEGGGKLGLSEEAYDTLKNMQMNTRKDGIERGFLITKDGKVASIIKGDSDKIVFGKEETDMIKNGEVEAIAHTHPVDIPFSGKDLENFVRFPTTSSYVATPDGTLYKVSKEKNYSVPDFDTFLGKLPQGVQDKVQTYVGTLKRMYHPKLKHITTEFNVDKLFDATVADEMGLKVGEYKLADFTKTADKKAVHSASTTIARALSLKWEEEKL